MSCLNLNKFLPARKAWRVFARKVQTKLHKLHPSKTINKKPPKKSSYLNLPRPSRKTSEKRSCWRAFCIQRKILKLKPTQTRRYHSSSYYFQKTPSAVYIDQLFIEPAVSRVKDYPQLNYLKAAAASEQVYNNNNNNNKEICSSSATTAPEAPEFVDIGNRLYKGKGKLGEAADDMWESLVLASPQMSGINERAEEFINKFRAEMMLQERLARQL